jgi:hypothetical protein
MMSPLASSVGSLTTHTVSLTEDAAPGKAGRFGLYHAEPRTRNTGLLDSLAGLLSTPIRSTLQLLAIAFARFWIFVAKLFRDSSA